MKLICAKNELLKSVNISLKAVSSKTTMPILECILIDASATEITFTSNDMELGIETKVKGIIEEKGIVALDAKLFSDIIRKLPDSDVCIQTDTNLNTTITCEKQNSQFQENLEMISLICQSLNVVKVLKSRNLH